MNACTFGLHSWDTITLLEIRDGVLVEVEIVRCARCGIRVSEEVWPA